MGSSSPVVDDPSDKMFVYLIGRGVGGVFVMVGEAMGGAVGNKKHSLKKKQLRKRTLHYSSRKN